MASAASAPCIAAAGSASPVRRYSSAPASKKAKSSAKPPTRSVDRLEQLDARLHDLVADPVAGEDRNLKLAHTHP